MPKEVKNYHEDESANLAFKEGIEAGFGMTKDVFQKMIINRCKSWWWHRFFFCSCKKLLVSVSGLSIELKVQKANPGVFDPVFREIYADNEFSDDEPIIIE